MRAMSDVKTPTKPAPAYEGDFYAWTSDQAARLREQKPKGIDWENVAEEIESVGRSEKHQLRSRMRVVLMHLLKWHFQPAKRKYGWRVTINYQRDMIHSILEDSPSLRRFPKEVLDDCYEAARLKAIEETDLAPEIFPSSCPYSLQDVLSQRFFPGPPKPDLL
jgi:hypothetical protein